MSTVFDNFAMQPYKFLTVERGTVRGNKIVEATLHEGVFKARSGMVQGEREVATSDATLHVKPEDYEDFKSVDDFLGHAILFNGVAYRIAGATAGTNFETGEMEHYRLTLEKEEYFNLEEYV